MDHISNIQELVDQQRESIPTGVVADIMRECQQAYKALPRLWNIHYLEVCAVSKNNLETQSKCLIVEEDAAPDVKYFYWFKVLNEGKIPPVDQHKNIKGASVHDGSRVRVIIKVEPYLKRAREE